MPDKQKDIDDLARKLFGDSQAVYTNKASPDQVDVIQTIARTIARTSSRVFECAKCSRKFKIPNAKQGVIYKCISCKIVMSEAVPEKLEVVDAKSAELVLDETLPPEVQEAFKKPENIFGRFILVEKLGEGAMGAVHRAFDVELGRYVALKFLKMEQVEELRAEARTLAGLEHKNIARIYDIGSAKGRGFIAMQLINGIPLGWARMSPDEMVTVMRTVCEAVDYAHKRGIIHRDLKPDNIMIDKEGNVYVMDFGLAAKNPKAAELAGTPGYMAPEIASFKPASPQTDVFSIASTLYHLVAGRSPLDLVSGDNLESALEKIKNAANIPIRTLVPGVSKELEAIINKGLNPDPSRRYQTAFEMANDLRKFQLGYPVSAFSTSTTYRIKKAIQRNKVVFAISVVSFIALVIAGIVAYTKYQEKQAIAEWNRQKAEETKRLEEETRRKNEEYEQEKKRVQDLVQALLEEFGYRYKEALERRRGGEPYANLSWIPKRILDSAMYNEIKGQAEKDPQVHYSIGRIYRAVGDNENAEKQLAAALQADAKFAPAVYEVGILTFMRYVDAIRLKLAQWRQSESERCMKEFFDNRQPSEPKEPSWQELEDAGLKKDLVEKLDTGIGLLEAGSCERLTEEGILALISGNPADARVKFTECLLKDKSFEDAVYGLAQTYSKKESSELLGFLSDAIKMDKGNKMLFKKRVEANQTLFVQESNQGQNNASRFTEIVKDCRELVRLDDGDKESWTLLGNAWKNLFTSKYYSGKDTSEEMTNAIQAYDKAIGLDKGDCELLVNRGRMLVNEFVRSGDDSVMSAAWNDLGAARRIAPKRYDVLDAVSFYHTTRGTALFRKSQDPSDDFKAALEANEAALAVDATQATGWLRRGGILMNQGLFKEMKAADPSTEYTEAVRAFEQALALDSDNYQVFISLGTCWTNLGNYRDLAGGDAGKCYEAAAKYLDMGIKTNPGAAGSYRLRGVMDNSIAAWHRKNNRTKEAVAAYEAAITDWEKAISIDSKLSADYAPVIEKTRERIAELNRDF